MRCIPWKDQKGAVLPFVALIMVFVIFGMMAIVVDAGGLYNVRKQMVTAADAAALAGAKEMEKNLSASVSESEKATIRAKAEQIAKSIATKNGAEGEPR